MPYPKSLVSREARDRPMVTVGRPARGLPWPLSETEIEQHLVAAGLAEQVYPVYAVDESVFTPRRCRLSRTSDTYQVQAYVPENTPQRDIEIRRIQAELDGLFVTASNVVVLPGSASDLVAQVDD